MDEAIFWKTMNPRRLHALYSSWFGAAKAKKPEKGGSLSEYLMGGG